MKRRAVPYPDSVASLCKLLYLFNIANSERQWIVYMNLYVQVLLVRSHATLGKEAEPWWWDLLIFKFFIQEPFP